MKQTSALILAAGTSRRMGRTKQRLDLAGKTLLEHVIERIMPFSFAEIIIVVGHEAKRIKRETTNIDHRCRWVFNPDYAKGQSTSFKRGIEAVKTAHVMVFLGDMPFIKHETIETIYENRKREKNPYVLRPVYRSIPGHPVLFGNISHLDFSPLTNDQGAKRLIKRMDDYTEIPVSDEGCIFDIDTPEAYEQAKQRFLS